MNTGTTCINGAEIASVLWKIGQNPFNAGMITPFTQGDTATALLKVELLDCDSFEGLTLEAFVQVPNPPDNSIVKIHATIDGNNKAIFTLPTELLWYPGDYDINFMFTDGSKVNYSNVLNASYQVLENPALAGEDPPTILPGDVAEYERLIAELNAENTRAETNLPLLEAENDRAEANIIAAGDINSELEGTIADAGTAKTELEGTITDSETAKANLEQTITDSETAKTNLEGTITDAGQAQSDLQDKIDEVPALIQSITDEGDTQVTRVTSEGDIQVTRVTNQGNTEVARVQAQGDTSVQAVKDQETASIIAVGDKGDEEYQRLNDLIQTSPTGGNAILLDGRTRTSFEEDIESRQYALDGRLVYAFEPTKRNIENLNYGMYIKNPLTNGDGTIKSEDADSMAGVFDDDNGNFYCGEGYDNITEPLGSAQGSPIQEYNGNILRIELSSTGLNTYSQLNYLQFLLGNDYTASWNVIKDENNIFQQISFSGQTFVSSDTSTDRKGSMTGSCDTSGNPNGIFILINGNIGEFIEIEIMVTKTSSQVPFVKDTAPDGKLIIKEPWTSATHSFIGLGIERGNTFAYLQQSSENSNGELFYSLLADVVGEKYDFLLSDIFKVCINSAGTELTTTLLNKYVSENCISVCRTNHPNKSNNIMSYFVYEGNLTEQELRNELAKIKSGQYYVENIGVFEPVQGAKRRSNEYGQIKNYVKLESLTTDIQLVETNKVVYTEAFDGTKRRDRIDGSGLITGDGGIIDVNGYIRLDASTGATANTPVKVVIEND